MTIQYRWILIGLVIGFLASKIERWIRKTAKKRKVVVFKTPGPTKTMKADAVGFCKRDPGHDGPCNGFPVVTCPGYQNWFKSRDKPTIPDMPICAWCYEPFDKQSVEAARDSLGNEFCNLEHLNLFESTEKQFYLITEFGWGPISEDQVKEFSEERKAIFLCGKCCRPGIQVFHNLFGRHIHANIQAMIDKRKMSSDLCGND